MKFNVLDILGEYTVYPRKQLNTHYSVIRKGQPGAVDDKGCSRAMHRQMAGRWALPISP